MNFDHLRQPLLSTPSGDLRFASPLFLLVLILLPFLLAWIWRRQRVVPSTLRFSNIALLRKALGRSGQSLARVLGALRILALGLLLVAMARPQFGRIERQTFSEGIDIMLVLDVSDSMRTQDFSPNRLEAAKQVIGDFVAGRMGDRLGLAIYGTEAVTLVPLTLDYGVVRSFVERVRFDIVSGRSTSIGMGLATALTKLKDSKAKSKVIILLTDGQNNSGRIDPMTAAEACKTAKIKVYTIGVGSDQSAMTPFGFVPDAGIDEKTLRGIADMTGGAYFHATDNKKLSSIYAQIDKLEKSRVESTQFDNFNELAPYAIFIALALIIMELIIGSTRMVKVP
ncbi:MAG: VWA domain-containing protein [bacterium]|nr:VWA domain-containing protein [Candidatus Sumerlaeota bacterium]